jgi:hypothetical protein
MKPIIGHYYRLNATRIPGRVYRCESIVGGQVNLTIVKRDPVELVPDVSIDAVRFEANATETEFP